MSGGGKIPLWVVATIAGLGVITVVGIFFYGAYAGVGFFYLIKSLNHSNKIRFFGGFD